MIASAPEPSEGSFGLADANAAGTAGGAAGSTAPEPASSPARHQRSPRRLPWILLLLLLPLALVPLALAGSFAYFFGRQVSQQQSLRYISDVASNQADLLEASIEHQHSLLTTFLNHPSLQSSLERTLGAADPAAPGLQTERQAIVQELQRLKESSPSIDEFALVLLGGEQDGRVLLASRTSWEGQLLGAGPILGLIQRASLENAGRATSQAVLNPQDLPGLVGSSGSGGDPNLVIFTAIPWHASALPTDQRLRPASAALLLLASPRAVQYMVSQAQSTSFANQENTQSVTVFFVIPQEQAFIGVNPNLETATKLFNFQPPQGGASQIFQDLQSGGAAPGSLSLIGQQGTPVLLGFAWLDSLQAGWAIQAPENLIEGQMGLPNFEQLRQLGLVAFGIVALLIAILLGWATLRLTAPLDTLVTTVQSYADGERGSGPAILPEQMRLSAITELNGLATAFNQIADEMQSLHQQLVRQNALQAELAQTHLQLSRSASVAASVDEFLRQALNLIIKRLGYPHAAIFMARGELKMGAELESDERVRAMPRALAVLRHALSAPDIAGTQTDAGQATQGAGLPAAAERSRSFPHPRELVSQAIATNRVQVKALPPQSGQISNTGRASSMPTARDAGKTTTPEAEAASAQFQTTLYQAALPITSGSQILGALSVIASRADPIQSEAESPNGFSDTELAELGALANTLALGILQLETVEAKQLSSSKAEITPLPSSLSDWGEGQEVQRRLAELEALWTISQVITLETDLTKLYRTIHEQVMRFTGEVSSFAIALYDASTDQIRIPYMYEEGKYVNIQPFPLGQGLSSIVIRSGQPLMLVEDTINRTRALGAITYGEPAKSWLGVPLRMANETFGLIIAQDLEHEQRFDEEDLRLISAIAAQVSVVVRNARLLETSRRQAEIERLVNEITAKIRRAVNPETIIRTTAEELVSALGAQRAKVQINLKPDEAGPGLAQADRTHTSRPGNQTQTNDSRERDR
ncbi:MAG: GAF domain-containing protein [Chloroflexota bacterium]